MNLRKEGKQPLRSDKGVDKVYDEGLGNGNLKLFEVV